MNNHKKIYTIKIAEPWDFVSPDGKNIIRGVIISILNSYLLIFKANYILNFDGVSGDILILSPRFKDENFEDIIAKDIDVNGALFLDDDNDGIKKHRLKENCKFVLIGTIESQK